MDNSYETPAIEETVSVTEPLNTAAQSDGVPGKPTFTPTWRRTTER